jgi:glycosyltransferase 2 family protein
MKKFLLGIFISIALIGVLIYKFDSTEFLRLWSKISYTLLIPAISTQLLGVLLSSVRWYYLTEKGITLKHCIASNYIGYGANMILPARGGDIFRIFYCRSESEMKSFNLLSKLFLEKIIDFILVIIIGICSFLLMGIKEGKAEANTIFTISGIVVLGILFSIYTFRFQNSFLRKMLLRITSLLGKGDFYTKHIDVHVEDLGEFLKIKNFIKPLLISFLIWSTYFTTHGIVSQMLSLDLTPEEISFVLFSGAMSLALPSAPSGVGVYHASIISAFLIVGRDANAGLVYATALHLVSFISLTSMGLIFYLFWVYKRRHSGKPISFDTN